MNEPMDAPRDEHLPTVAEPLPGYLGKPGLRLSRRLIAESWRPGRTRPNETQAAILAEMAADLKRALVPAQPEAIGRLVEALMWHYPALPRPERAAASVAADWLRDLGHLPEDLVDAGCAGWRRGTNAFAPTPGHLLAIADPILAARRNLATMVARLLAPAAEPAGLATEER